MSAGLLLREAPREAASGFRQLLEAPPSTSKARPRPVSVVIAPSPLGFHPSIVTSSPLTQPSVPVRVAVMTPMILVLS